MQEQSFYPVKAISRAATRKRNGKLRLAWFAVGAAFGIGCAYTLVPDSGPSLLTADGAPTLNITMDVSLGEEKAQEVTLLGADGEEVATASTAIPDTNYPLNLDLKVARGDTMITLLTDAGVPHEEAYTIVQAMTKTFNPKKLDIGQTVSVTLDKPAGAERPIVARMVMPMSLTSTLEVSRSGADFSVKKVDAPVEQKLAHAGGLITSSLYETGVDSGIPASLLSEIINALSYDIDFQRDIRTGHTIDVLYERAETKEGAIAGYGNVIFAELGLGSDKSLKIYRFTDKSGDADYYNEKGESVRKALLRTPINGARITSRFGMRNHPILGYTKMHRGVDFGAPTGTPIYAAGDGKVDFTGVKNGYGNYLRIRHSNNYATAYAHISRFASGVKPGSRVKQGQIVAYVGATGQATGPHLHYEVLMGNSQVNPANVKFKTGTVLKGTELANFRKVIEKVDAQIAAMPKGSSIKLAQADISLSKSEN